MLKALTIAALGALLAGCGGDSKKDDDSASADSDTSSQTSNSGSTSAQTSSAQTSSAQASNSQSSTSNTGSGGGSQGASTASTRGGNAEDDCARGCEDTLAADCDNGPQDQEQCVSDCVALVEGNCGVEYRALQACAEGEEISCLEGIPFIAACAEEQGAFLVCISE